MVAIQKNLENALCPECDKPLVNIRPRDESSISLDDDGDGDDNASSIAGGSQSWGSDTERDFRRFQKLQERSRASRETMVEDDYGRVLGNDMLGQQPRLKKENTMFLRASDKRYPEPMVPSAKTTMVKEIVLRWQSEAPEDKVIIFTQFLEESQIIGRMLQSENMSFLYFYGDMGQKKKQKALEKFRTEPSAKVLVSLITPFQIILLLTTQDCLSKVRRCRVEYNLCQPCHPDRPLVECSHRTASLRTSIPHRPVEEDTLRQSSR